MFSFVSEVGLYHIGEDVDKSSRSRGILSFAGQSNSI